MKISPHFRQSALVIYQTRIRNADGSIASERAPKKNLIYDNGLNMAASTAWVNCFYWGVVGTGTGPTNRDSAAITVDLAGGVLTANAPLWVPADVGRLFKFDSGEEVYITGYTSNLIAATTSVLVVPASIGTIWYVNDNSMTAEVKRTNIRTAGGALNGTSFASPVLTLKRTMIFSAEVAPITYKEIGWSNTNIAGGNLFGRDLIPGGGDALLAGQQYEVTVRLLITIAPVAIAAIANVGGPFDTSGNHNIQCLSIGALFTSSFSWIDVNGDSNGSFGLEPALGSCSCVAEDTAYVLLAGPSAGLINTSGNNAVINPDGYVAGSFSRTGTGTFSIVTANYSIKGLSFGSGLARGYSVLFTTPQVKDNIHTLTVVLRVSWNRILANP